MHLGYKSVNSTNAILVFRASLMPDRWLQIVGVRIAQNRATTLRYRGLQRNKMIMYVRISKKNVAIVKSVKIANLGVTPRIHPCRGWQQLTQNKSAQITTTDVAVVTSVKTVVNIALHTRYHGQQPMEPYKYAPETLIIVAGVKNVKLTSAKVGATTTMRRGI